MSDCLTIGDLFAFPAEQQRGSRMDRMTHRTTTHRQPPIVSHPKPSVITVLSHFMGILGNRKLGPSRLFMTCYCQTLRVTSLLKRTWRLMIQKIFICVSQFPEMFDSEIRNRHALKIWLKPHQSTKTTSRGTLRPADPRSARYDR